MPSEDERIFRDNVAEFCRKHIAPKWIDIDERGEIDPQLIKRMADMGLIGLTVSEEYGGQGGSFLEAAIAGEELAYHAPALSLAVLYLLQCSWPYVVERYGMEEAKAEVLTRVTRGEAAVGIASTEAHGGSDVAGVMLKAERRSDGRWVLNGEKAMASLPTIIERLPWGGGWFLIARSGDPAQKHKTITSFLTLLKKNGIRDERITYRPWTEFARRGLDTAAISFNGVEIDDIYRIGDVNGGFRISMEGFNLARSIIGSVCIGCARWLLDQGIEWIKNRRLFGKPIATFQGINFKLADYWTELEAARLLCYKTAWMADRYYRNKDPNVKLSDVALISAMSKLKCAGLAVDIGEDVMKWFGGAAYFKEVPIFRAWLAAFSYVIGAEGTENVMKYIIARGVLGKDYVT